MKVFTCRNFSAMRKQNILRTLLFVVFFSLAAATLAMAILCKDLHQYYLNKAVFKRTQQRLEQLKSLNKDYDFLLNQLQADPNLVERLGPAILGTKPEQANTIYPKAKAEQLAAAKKALTENMSRKAESPEIPEWLDRCNEPTRRIGLFVAGGALTIISFVCFNHSRKKEEES